MKRRTVLAGSGIALSISLGGCLGTGAEGDDESGRDNGTKQPESSSGNGSCIYVSELPSEVQTEVETAIETGEYETCGNLELLDEIELSENPVLLFEETAYEPVVAHGDAGPDAECSSTYNLQMEQINRDQAC